MNTRTHRMGLLTPSSNTTQQSEFVEVLPRTVSLHRSRHTTLIKNDIARFGKLVKEAGIRVE